MAGAKDARGHWAKRSKKCLFSPLALRETTAMLAAAGINSAI